MENKKMPPIIPHLLGAGAGVLTLLCILFVFAAVTQKAYLPAYLLSVNGVPVGYVSDRGEAEQLLQTMQNDADMPEGAAPVLTYQAAEIPTEALLSQDALRHALLSHSVGTRTRGYTLTVGDTVVGCTADVSRLPEILAACDALAAERFSERNGSILPEQGVLQRTCEVTYTYGWVQGEALLDDDGIKAALLRDDVLSYVMIYDESEVVLLPYETVYVENDADFNGYTTMIAPGADGLARVTRRVTLDPASGTVLQSCETGRTELVSPVARQAYYGLYPLLDESVCTGTFLWPIDEPTAENLKYTDEQIGWNSAIPRVYMSSGYGARDLWGTYDYHLGYDIVAAAWTELHACDGGVVVYAGFSGSYGYSVRILHKDGVESLYAHQCKLAVKAGDVVTQGQLIGYVGSSGNTSGPHLHLEFRKDHVTCDPALFIDLPAWLRVIGG